MLVGNVPPVDRLPAYLACLPVHRLPTGRPARSPSCRRRRRSASSWARTTTRSPGSSPSEGATLVDLSRERDLSRLTADDGFHPSTQGHRLVAAAFARALNQDGA